MQFRNARSLPSLVVMCILATMIVVAPVITYALPVQKNAYSFVGHPWWLFWSDDIVSESTARASHLRLWGTDHWIHTHYGDGYAHASLGSRSDSKSGKFNWLISSTNSPSHPHALSEMTVSVSLRGPESSSGSTYCWVRSDGGSATYSSDAN